MYANRFVFSVLVHLILCRITTVYAHLALLRLIASLVDKLICSSLLDLLNLT